MNKVICVSNKGWERLPLTIGKMYDVLKKENIPFSPQRYDDASGPFYKVKCDTGEEKYFEESRFRDLTLSEKRELKINQVIGH